MPGNTGDTCTDSSHQGSDSLGGESGRRGVAFSLNAQMMAVKDRHDDDEDAQAASNGPVRGAADGKVEFTALRGQRSGRCTTHTHIVVHAAKTQTDALVENPEF